jgi:hypothetical protein
MNKVVQGLQINTVNSEEYSERIHGKVKIVGEKHRT